MAAQHGYKVVIRQTMFQGHYSLVGKDMEPNPVSWMAFICIANLFTAVDFLENYHRNDPVSPKWAISEPTSSSWYLSKSKPWKWDPQTATLFAGTERKIRRAIWLFSHYKICFRSLLLEMSLDAFKTWNIQRKNMYLLNVMEEQDSVVITFPVWFKIIYFRDL